LRAKEKTKFWLRRQEHQTSLIGFVGKKSTSLDSEVDEEQEMTKSKKNKFAEEEKIEREKED
jgi:hypothetical protein